MSLLIVGGWTRWPLKVPFNPKHSMILNIGTVCLEWAWSLHPWRYSKADCVWSKTSCTWPWATFCTWSWFQQVCGARQSPEVPSNLDDFMILWKTASHSSIVWCHYPVWVQYSVYVGLKIIVCNRTCWALCVEKNTVKHSIFFKVHSTNRSQSKKLGRKLETEI